MPLAPLFFLLFVFALLSPHCAHRSRIFPPELAVFFFYGLEM